MGTLDDFLTQLDGWGLLALFVNAVAALMCITIHELSHGFAAYRLGDPTAKAAGRLTLNPIRHLDLFGLVMLLVVKVGWAKPVPVDMRYFKRPKRDMAITALAGPASNFLTALVALAVCSLIYHLAAIGKASIVALCFFSNVAMLSVGLGLFNLIPISPLDGSKVLFSFLPDRVYGIILRYERYAIGLLLLLTLLGVFQRPLSFLILAVLQGFCAVTQFPLTALMQCQDLSRLAALFSY